MKQIFCASHARGPVSTDELERLLAVARRHNAQRRLKGLPVQLIRSFMRVLERPDQALALTLRRTSADERHEMLAVWSGPTDARVCPESQIGDARMGAAVFGDTVTLTSVPRPDIDPLLRRLLNAFRAGFRPSGMRPFNNPSWPAGAATACAARVDARLAASHVIPLKGPM